MTILLAGLSTSSSASDIVGSGGIGARGGTLLFTQDAQIKEDAQPRLSGDAVFSYVWSDHLTFDVTVGYGWNRLTTGDTNYYVVTATPLTLGARFFLRDGRSWRPYVAGGGGMYVWSILTRDLGAAKDPLTFERLRRARPGMHGLLGVERRMGKHISMTGDLGYHYIFAEDTDNFPSGFNGNKAYAQARLGVTFYFSLSERIDTGLPE
ncbi:MAG: outer membrane beta-barrel protein [Candidatus Latescibacteria bacterium]|nr:outer membrane beta-barrel protein [Candidatus Latescibacterota bacterium]